MNIIDYINRYHAHMDQVERDHGTGKATARAVFHGAVAFALIVVVVALIELLVPPTVIAIVGAALLLKAIATALRWMYS